MARLDLSPRAGAGSAPTLPAAGLEVNSSRKACLTMLRPSLSRRRMPHWTMHPMPINDSHRQVSPARPPAPYVGGKKILARRICDLIETIPHRAYVEAFVGFGGVFLRRRSAPPAEVINDLSGDVATFFRILQRHYPQFMDTLRFQITSRREFLRLEACDPATLTDLERAARFLYLQRLSFGGRVVDRTFGVDPLGTGGRFNLNKLGPLLEEVHERLAGVVIENRDWAKLIVAYDRPGTLFYLDPPYLGHEGDYGAGLFDAGQFARMAELLRGIRGRFILSINDHPTIRQLFAGFELIDVELNYTTRGGGNPKPARELIITG